MSDSNKIIAASIQVDTGNSNTNVQQLNKSINDVKGNLKDVGGISSVASKEIEGAGGSFGKLKEQMSALPGPLGESVEGVGKLNLSFKALLANPVVLIITAIIAALALLYKAFTNSFEGGEKMEQIFAGIKAAGQALIDNITKIAGAIVKLMAFDFSGAIMDIKEVAGAAADAFNKMAQLTKEAQELHREQLANDLDQAKRAKELAILREQATDESIPVAKRKAALLELKKEAEQNAADDIALAKKVTENKIAQLTLEKDGAKKNQDEITKLKIDQINVETDNANELRRIGKQITAANKQELAEQKAAAEKAKEEAKKRREEIIEFTNKLLKIQQDTELAAITDTYEKEKKQLENKIADDKRTNELAFQDKKITRAQHDAIDQALDEQARVARATLADKHKKEIADKEAAFQKDLAGIRAKIREGAETDANALERIKLQAEHEQRVADAAKTYKDDAIKFQAIKNALDEQLKTDQDKLEAKVRLEQEKKRTDLQIQAAKAIQDNAKATFAARIKAIDVEQALFKQQFEDKIITEKEYNDKVKELTDARINIKKAEHDATLDIEQKIGDAFGQLSDIAGKQTAAGKALAVVQTTISTFVSGQKAFESLVGIPVIGPALAAVAAASAIASGIANVKKIIAVDVPGQGSGGATAPTSISTPAAPVAPTQVSTTFNAQNNPTSGNATSNRAYVVDADIQNAQDRNARLSRAARLGG